MLQKEERPSEKSEGFRDRNIKEVKYRTANRMKESIY
jgi:hypothetical protein